MVGGQSGQLLVKLVDTAITAVTQMPQKWIVDDNWGKKNKSLHAAWANQLVSHSETSYVTEGVTSALKCAVY